MTVDLTHTQIRILVEILVAWWLLAPPFLIGRGIAERLGVTTLPGAARLLLSLAAVAAIVVVGTAGSRKMSLGQGVVCVLVAIAAGGLHADPTRSRHAAADGSVSSAGGRIVIALLGIVGAAFLVAVRLFLLWMAFYGLLTAQPEYLLALPVGLPIAVAVTCIVRPRPIGSSAEPAAWPEAPRGPSVHAALGTIAE